MEEQFKQINLVNSAVTAQSVTLLEENCIFSTIYYILISLCVIILSAEVYDI